MVRAVAPGYPERDLALRFAKRRYHLVPLYESRLQWTMYGATPQRTQAHAAIKLRPPFHVVWHRHIGYDSAGKHYVVHWIDVFGGHFSQTLGSGKRDGNALAITFDYPDGEFQNTFTFDPKDRTWISLMRQKDKSGNWSTFAEDHFRRTPAK